ncbi:histidine phosphatase family protein [Streptomyces sp. NPDC021212]|uniref:histidine phosphatase family protein n=1 Tax=Streptomyces sp. NPDC021212 TaxID=3365118 RepID=UPI0037BAA151
MTFRLTLVVAAATSGRLGERFGDDRPLDPSGRLAAERAAPGLLPLAAAELRYCSPSPRSRETGLALGFTPLAQLALRDWDMGRWSGRTLADVMAREPRQADAWLADPRSAPHGGEPLVAFITRVGRWLDTRPVEEHTKVLAVADPWVVRAALTYAIKAPPHCYWNVDVAPLSTVALTGRAGQWRLRVEGDAPK